MIYNVMTTMIHKNSKISKPKFFIKLKFYNHSRNDHKQRKTSWEANENLVKVFP